MNLGLDTDIIAAITGSLTGVYYGYNRIPPEWLAVHNESNMQNGRNGTF